MSKAVQKTSASFQNGKKLGGKRARKMGISASKRETFFVSYGRLTSCLVTPSPYIRALILFFVKQKCPAL